MTRAQIAARLRQAETYRVRASMSLRSAIAGLKEASTSARRYADALPTETDAQVTRAEAAGVRAERLETALGDLEVAAQEVEGVDLSVGGTVLPDPKDHPLVKAFENPPEPTPELIALMKTKVRL